MENMKEIVKQFYTDCLTVNNHADPVAVMQGLLADNFQSMSGTEIKPKQALMGQVQFFWKLIPDLKWEVQEMLEDGNRVVVRSMASGTPHGDFMGMPVDGSKSFKIMAIDIHTVEAGQITQVYHVEEWAVAMKQLRGQ